ncbi:MAG: hypothetical protein V4732_02555 [Pseudomonadota bacterium]
MWARTPPNNKPDSEGHLLRARDAMNSRHPRTLVVPYNALNDAAEGLHDIA